MRGSDVMAKSKENCKLIRVCSSRRDGYSTIQDTEIQQAKAQSVCFASLFILINVYFSKGNIFAQIFEKLGIISQRDTTCHARTKSVFAR